MVTTGNDVAQETAKRSRKKLSKKWRIVLAVVGVCLVIAAIVVGAIFYMNHLSQSRIDLAREEAQVVIADPVKDRVLGGDDYVTYRGLLAAKDEQAARGVYVDPNETEKTLKSAMCYKLFNAAMKASQESDVRYASDCIDQNGAGIEILDSLARDYKQAGDMTNARKYAGKIADIARDLDLDSVAKEEMRKTLKELGYEGDI